MTFEKKTEVIDALAEFVIRVTRDSAIHKTTPEEVEVLPRVAELLLSQGIVAKVED